MRHARPKAKAEAAFEKEKDLQNVATGYRAIVDSFLFDRSPEVQTQLGAFISAIESNLPHPSDDSPRAIGQRVACQSAQETLDKLKSAMKEGAPPQPVNQLLEAFLTFWGDTSLLLWPDSKMAASKEIENYISDQNKSNVEARHNKPGGSREKRELVIQAWKSGHYSSKDRCAEEEAAAIGIAFSTARKALRNQ